MLFLQLNCRYKRLSPIRPIRLQRKFLLNTHFTFAYFNPDPCYAVPYVVLWSIMLIALNKRQSIAMPLFTFTNLKLLRNVPKCTKSRSHSMISCSDRKLPFLTLLLLKYQRRDVLLSVTACLVLIMVHELRAAWWLLNYFRKVKF